VEVAVAAAHRAERHVDVDPEWSLAEPGQRRDREAAVARRRLSFGQGGRHRTSVPTRDYTGTFSAKVYPSSTDPVTVASCSEEPALKTPALPSLTPSRWEDRASYPSATP